MEQLPVKIKGGSYVSKCENYGVFVFIFLLFVSVFLQKHYKNRGFRQVWPLFSFDLGVQKVGSIIGTHLCQ